MNHPGPWQHFKNRLDNRGLSVEQMKQKFLKEEVNYYNTLSTMQQLKVINAASNGGTRRKKGLPPLPSGTSYITSNGDLLTDNQNNYLIG